MKQWYVFYTKSRHEKKVQDLLLKGGFDVFLPMQKVMRQWSDRKKQVEAPLFNSYIFVHVTEDQIVNVLQTPGVAWNIRHNGKPAILHEKEYQLIRRFLESGYFIETAGNLDLETGDRVEVIDGPLKGLSGTFIRNISGNMFSVVIESISQNLVVSMDARALKKLD